MGLLAYLGNEPVPVRIVGGPFRGARLILNPAHSKRKIVGAYEHVLNPWLTGVVPRVQVVWDVGAHDGYFTYGCAHVMGRHGQHGHVIALEPDRAHASQLEGPSAWPMYAHVSFEFIAERAGRVCGQSATTLRALYDQRSDLQALGHLFKVDVEGDEINVLTGAESLLERPNHWLVEIHGDHLLGPAIQCFEQANRRTETIRAKPHWLLGPEARTIDTCWLTTLGS